MNRALTALAAVGALAVAIPAAAQSWAPINARQTMLENRIEQGMRDGTLNRREATRLRGEFSNILDLEARYRVNGLSGAERADLDRRFDILSAQIRSERADVQTRGGPGAWQSIDRRMANLERRIERGLDNGSLTRREAGNLRREFREVVNLEARYSSNGLSNWERADLDRRFDQLSARVRFERADNQFR